MTAPTSDAGHLLLRARSGDGHAFAILFDQHVTKLLVYFRNRAARVVLADQDEDDLIQETFFQAWSHRNQLRTDPESSFGAWLFQIAWHVMQNRVRYVQGKGRQHVRELTARPGGGPDALPETITTPSMRAARREEADRVDRALRDVGPEDREMFLRYHVQEQTLRTIAEEVGLSHATVAMRVRAVGLSLRRRLEAHAKESAS